MQLLNRRVSRLSLVVANLTILAVSGLAQPSLPLNQTPSRAVGTNRLNLVSSAPNTPEGREFYWPVAVTIDNSVSPPILYVADSRNNRVLAWKNAAAASGSPADLVLGQKDRLSTTAKGPGTDFAGGFSNPTGVVTDGVGNLYVADSGNNRVLRFPAPFQQDPEFLAPDMVIGQRNLNENQPNQANVVAENTINSRQFTSVLPITLAIEPAGNLWVTDPFNHRVLRFPSSVLAAGRNNPAADVALGVVSLTARANPNEFIFTQAGPLRKDALYQPTGVAVDRRGRVFVRDWMPNYSRVLVWDTNAPLVTGRDATRILGIPPQDPNLPPIGDTVITGVNTGNLQSPRPGVTIFNGFVYVPDAAANRILVFDPFESWAAETPARFSPAARGVVGQDTFNQGRRNRGRTDVSANGFSYPVSVAATNSELYVADTFNNRVVVMPGSGAGFNAANRVLGQDRFDQNAPNLVEGKEFYFYDGLLDGRLPFAGSTFGGTCLALDGNRLYVADPANNRVLGFRDVRQLRPGNAADLVVGQPDLAQSQPNWPNGDADSPSQSGLSQPTCVAVDTNGDLWVADSGNGRVLRFPKPFDQAAGARRNANLVLGQQTFTANNTDPTSRTMRHPAGLAFTTTGNLLVSDLQHHRVLRFRKAPGADFQSGQVADAVFGQSSFSDSARRVGRELNRLSHPKGIALDASDRLYVAEVTTPNTAAGNLGDRVVIFSDANDPSVTVNPTARQPVDGLAGPQGIYVNKQTGEGWISNSAGNAVVVIPRFEEIFGASITPVQVIPLNIPMAVTLDENGVMLVADGLQRVALYYPRATAASAAGGDRFNLAPGMYASIYGPSGIFGAATKLFTEEANPLPMPSTVGDLQVLFNDKPAPIHFVSPAQINAIVPSDISTAAPAEITIVRASTGQVLAAARVNVEDRSPSLFTTSGAGSGQLAAVNQDGTVNSSANPAPRGSIITLFGTGLGVVPNGPQDGAIAQGLLPAPGYTRVNINGRFVPDADLQYSGLAPGSINLWQINVKIPDTVPPNNNTPIAVQYRDTNAQTRLTIAVR